MEVLFFILWLVSVIFWLIYAIKTFIGLIKDKDIDEVFLKMIISYILVSLFCILMKIV